MSLVSIAPIAGVPDELLRVLNDRLRAIDAQLGRPSTTPATVVSSGGPSVAVTGASNIMATHAERGSAYRADDNVGAYLFETDRGLTYQSQLVAGAAMWVYLYGVMSGALADKPAGLGTHDKGLLFEATDYRRVFRWTGSAWERAPGERPTREFCYFAEDPGSGWRLCDGSAGVTYTKANCTTATMTLPNETAGVYRKSGAVYNGSTTPATLPAISGGSTAESAGTPAGTVSAPTFNGNPLPAHQHKLPFGTNGSTIVSGNYGQALLANITDSYHMAAVLGGGTQPYTFLSDAISAGSASGAVTAPTFSGSAMTTHSHGAGTYALSAAAEPANVVMLPYMKL